MRRRLELALAITAGAFAGTANFEEARAALEQACKLAPSNPAAHYRLGVLFDGHDWPAQAVPEFRKTLAIDPANSSAWDYLALNLELTGDPASAEAAYKAGLKVNDARHFDPFLGYNYGRFLMKRGRLTESKPYLDGAVELSPQVRAVYYERGKLHLALGDFTYAKADAERALARPDPGGFVLDGQIYSLLAVISRRQGNGEAAKQYADLARAAAVPVRSEGRR